MKRVRIKTQPEHDFVNALLVALSHDRSLRVWRQNVASLPIRDEQGTVQRWFRAGVPKGAADISGILVGPGLRIEIECKVAGRKRTPHQTRWGEFISCSGGVYAVVDGKEGLKVSLERVYEAIGKRSQ